MPDQKTETVLFIHVFLRSLPATFLGLIKKNIGKRTRCRFIKRGFVFIFCSIFLWMNARADYTIASGTNVNASTLVGQSGVLTINGTLTISSNVTLSGFTAIIVNAPNGEIYWSNNSDLTFSAGTSITIASGAPGLQSSGNNSSQRLIVGNTIIAVSNNNSTVADFSFSQFNAMGGLPTFTMTPSSFSPVCVGTSVTAGIAPDRTVSGVTYSYSWSISPSSGTFTYNSDKTSATIASGAGTYTIRCIASANTYNDTLTISATVNAVPSTPAPGSNSPICAGTDINLTTPNLAGATYSWTGPNSFITTGRNPAISNATSAMAGTYTVTVTSSAGCTSASASTVVSVNTSYTWFGTDINWDDVSNWCPGIPNSSNNITIPSTSNNPVIASGITAQVNNLTVASGATLTVNGTLQVSGTITNNGTIDATNGTIEMNGASAQSIAGSMFYNKTIKNLIASNPAGLSVSSTANDTLKILGGLTFGNSSATLNTGDNIDLLSTQSQTAYLGVVGSGNTVTGSAIVDRYINVGTGSGQHSKSWEFLAFPTTGATVKGSIMENGNNASGYGIWLTSPEGTAAGFDATSYSASIKSYHPSTNAWDGVSNSADQIHNEEGYMVFVRGDRTVNGTTVTTPKTTILRSKGTLLTGSQSAISVSPGYYQSIANPYASPIDFTQLSRADGVDNLFYAWDPYLYGVYGYGGYQTISATNGWVPVPGGTTAYPTGVVHSTIQSGQAFFVHATTNTSLVAQNPTISISENSKVSGSSNVNFARVASRGASPERQFLRTDLFLSTNPGAPVADGNAVAFDNSFSNKVDGNDALKLMNSGENFGLKRDGKSLAVEARAPVTAADTIFYNMSSMKQQTYQLRIIPVNMQSDNLQAYLLDQFLNTSTSLSLSDTNFVTFSVTSNAASKAASRFMIVFRQMAALPVTLTSVRATLQNNNNVLVEWVTQNESGMLQYEVEKSTDGNNFQTSGITFARNNGAENYQWIDSQLTEGNNYYRIRIVSKDGKVSYSDIVKVYVGKTIASIIVAPNPILNGVIHLEFRNGPLGYYEISVTNIAGQMVFSKTFNHNIRNQDESVTPPSIAKGIYQLSITKPDGNVEVMKIVY